MSTRRMLPASRPQITRDALATRIAAAGHTLNATRWPLYIVGIRGYYLDTMGERGRNDRGVYDDALFVVSPNVFATFNGNTDPSTVRRGMAVLRPGLYFAHKIGRHKTQYPALIQRNGPVVLDRDETGEDRGFFGINIHRGGAAATWSEGCQTIPSPQWEAFINLVVGEQKRLFPTEWQSRTIPYVLLEEQRS